MTIFLIVSQPNPNEAKLPGAIASVYPNDSLQVGDKAWFVASNEPVQEVSKKLGVTDGTNGAAIIAAISAYQGRANPNIWNWVKSKWELKANE